MVGLTGLRLLGLINPIVKEMVEMNYLFTSSTLYAVFGVYSFTVWRALWLGVLCGFLFKGSGSSTNK